MIETAEKQINKLQVLIGVVSLLIGTMVYFLDRPAEGTYFIYRFEFILRLHSILNDMIPGSFGFIGNWLPEFIHVFSFILLTAGIISCSKRGCVIICIAWFLVDALFELGQRYSSLTLKIVPDWFSDIPILESVEGYFLKGTFDVADLAAISAGAIAAYIVFLMTTDRPAKL